MDTWGSGEVKVIGLPVRTRLHLLRIRLSARLFCWLADHCPHVAELWALRGRR